MAKCRTCHAEIVWGMTESGKRVPLDPPEKRYVKNRTTAAVGGPQVEIQDTWLSHFATCPQADQHRKGLRGQEQSLKENLRGQEQDDG